MIGSHQIDIDDHTTVFLTPREDGTILFSLLIGAVSLTATISAKQGMEIALAAIKAVNAAEANDEPGTDTDRPADG